MSENNGGPAFPREDYQCNGADGGLGQEGMSLRDYFAAKAMQSTTLALSPSNQKLIAKAAYSMADEMLKARGE